MKKWTIVFTVLAALFSAQASLINFNESAYSTAGDGAALVSVDGWTGNAENVLTNTTTTGAVLLGTDNSAWKYNTYATEVFDMATVGDSFTTTIQFTFDSTATNAAAGGATTRASKRLIAVGSSADDMYGCLCRSWDRSADGAYALGYDDDNDPNKVVFNGEDIGIDGLGVYTSDLLQMSTTLTREAGDTWAMSVVLLNLDTAFTISYSTNGIEATKESMSGSFGVGQADSNSSVTARTVTSFEVIPEPATIGMLGLGALITLLVRRFKRA